jgi:hypothetical protein
MKLVDKLLERSVSKAVMVDIANLLPDKDNMEVAVDSLRKGERSGDLSPIKVYKSGKKYIVADGHHRLLQAIINRDSSILAHIIASETPISRRGTIRLDLLGGDYYGLNSSLENGWLISRL